MKRYTPKKIIIEQDAADLPLTQAMLKRLEEGVPREFAASLKPHLEEMSSKNWHDAQDTLVLCKNRGRFFEPCPGTQRYLCCGYSILNFAANCPLNCTYCILQSYLNNPCMVVYANAEEMLKELDDALDHHPETFSRVKTVNTLTAWCWIISPRSARCLFRILPEERMPCWS